MPCNSIKEYTDSVCDRIKWKKAAKNVACELENHLIDQRNMYMEYGMSENEAELKAVKQMGDPETVGCELDKIHRPEPQIHMIILTAMIFISGILIRMAVRNSIFSEYSAKDTLFCLMAAAVFIMAYRTDFSFLGRNSMKIFLVSLFIGITAVFYIRDNGMRVWTSVKINVLLSLIYPLSFSLLVYSQREKGMRGIIVSTVGYLLFSAVLLQLPSIAGMFALTAAYVFVMDISVRNGSFGKDKRKERILLTVFIAAVILLGVLYIASMPYYIDRLNGALFPEKNADTSGFLTLAVRDIVKGANIFGRGSVSEISVTEIIFTPMFYNDYLITIILYKFGWIAAVLVIAVFAAFMVIGFRKTFKQKSYMGFLMSFSVMISFTAQAVTYISSNLGFRMFEAVSMPLFSYGNTALIVNMALIGLMLSAFRTGKEQRDIFAENGKKVTLEDGKLIINLR